MKSKEIKSNQATSEPESVLTKEDFDSKNVKERITIWIDEDVLDRLRAIANEKTGGKYQTLINQMLRSSVETVVETVKKNESFSSRFTKKLVVEMARMKAEVKELNARQVRTEKAVIASSAAKRRSHRSTRKVKS